MVEPDIDGTLPGQRYDNEDESQMNSDEIRRDEDAPPEPRYSDDYDYDTYSSDSNLLGSSDPDALKEKLSLIAGASLMALFAYFNFVIGWSSGAPLLYCAGVAILVAVTTWFYMRGSSTMDPVRANFLAGALAGVSVIVVYSGLTQVDIMQMLFSGLLAGVTSSSLMKASSK